MIRLSIGLETLDDILWDIDQALARRSHDPRSHLLMRYATIPWPLAGSSSPSHWSRPGSAARRAGRQPVAGADRLPDAGLDHRRALTRADAAAAAASRPILLGCLVCAALMGWALWLQYGLDLDPCPLCVFQRIAVIATGVVFLIAAIHNPGRSGAVFYALLTVFVSGIGAAPRRVARLDPGAAQGHRSPPAAWASITCWRRCRCTTSSAAC